MSGLPIFWSFRRCPYAMRARLAVQASGVQVALQEILLKEKPAAFLETSASGTVPALQDGDLILDESLDIMYWALGKSDPDGWLNIDKSSKALIAECDGPFKTALDHTKYAVRYPDVDSSAERQKAAAFLMKLESLLDGQTHLYGDQSTIADMAILPFVRQFANTDRDWFDTQPWPHVVKWLDGFTTSTAFASVMKKYKPWAPDQDQVIFPTPL